jgi:hypothetical protein
MTLQKNSITDQGGAWDTGPRMKYYLFGIALRIRMQQAQANWGLEVK